MSFSGHLRFEDEDLLEEIEDIGFENLILFTGMSVDTHIEDIDEVPFEELHRKYYVYVPFKDFGH